MARFFVSSELLQQTQILLDEENARHARVLRLRAGNCVTLCDGEGLECSAEIAGCSNGTYLLNLSAPQRARSEPFCRVSVYMAYAKADKLDHVVQKATELGAIEVVVFPSDRCVSRPEARSLPGKLERWQRIARSAAEQSGRGRIPTVMACPTFADALERAAGADRALFFYENERQRSLRTALAGSLPASVSLMTGPEGGFTPQEAAQAEAAGLLSCSLGPRILRCETAPLCALSALLFAVGELE